MNNKFQCILSAFFSQYSIDYIKMLTLSVWLNKALG